MANNRTLKALSKILGLSQGYLKGVAGGKGKSDSELFRSNAANICRAMAGFIGYASEKRLSDAISRNISHIYTASEVLADRIEKILPKYGELKRSILTEAVEALRAGNLAGYNKALRKHKDLHHLTRKTSKTVNAKLIDNFRSKPQQNRHTASQILISVGGGKKIITTQSAINKEVKKRLKRWGAVGSLFWQSAKQLHEKIRPNKIGRHKTKKHKPSAGASFSTKFSHSSGTGEITVDVTHNVNDNARYMKKLNTKLNQQCKFWMKKLKSEMLGKKYLGKYLNQLK